MHAAFRPVGTPQQPYRLLDHPRPGLFNTPKIGKSTQHFAFRKWMSGRAFSLPNAAPNRRHMTDSGRRCQLAPSVREYLHTCAITTFALQ